MFLFEIAIYFWFRSIRGTTEFQFAFRCKSTRNYIFEITNCGRITLIFLCWRNGSKRSLFSNRYLVCHATRSLSNGKIEGVVWRDQTTAAKETTVSVAPMHFISTWKHLGNRDSRSYNICVSSDKLGCFLSFCDIFVFWKLCYVSDKNENIKCTNCPTSTHPAKNITLACWACLCVWLEKSAGKSNCIRPEMKIKLCLPER